LKRKKVTGKEEGDQVEEEYHVPTSLGTWTTQLAATSPARGGLDLTKEENKLLNIPRSHRATIGYSLDDLKGISPALCMYKINLEEDAKLIVDHQCRLT
jgi:hypothetical protein